MPAARADVVHYSQRTAGTFTLVDQGLDLEFGTHQLPPVRESTLGYFRVHGTGPTTLTFRFHVDTGSFLFTFGLYRVTEELASIDVSTPEGKIAYATQALAAGNATVIFDDLLDDPGKVRSLTLDGGAVVGFFLIPDGTLAAFQSGAGGYALEGIGSQTLGYAGGNRWPLFAFSGANPDGMDQQLCLQGTSRATGHPSVLLAWEDLSRANLPGNQLLSDSIFNDMLVGCEGLDPVEVFSPAAPYVAEIFDYPAGALTTRNAGTGFGSAYAGGGSVVPGILRFEGTDHSVIQGPGTFYRTQYNPVSTALRPLATNAFPASTLENGRVGSDGTVLYIGMLARTSGTSAFGGLLAVDGSDVKFWMGVPAGATKWGVAVGDSTHLSSAPAGSGTRFLVARIAFQPGPESVRFYVDPPPSAEPTTPSIPDFEIPDFRFQSLALGSSAGAIDLGEIRLGGSYAAVAGDLGLRFTVQPASTNLLAGGSVDGLLSQAVGLGPIQYQWLKDGKPLTGETGPNLRLLNATRATMGDYQVVASNPRESITSGVARVTVEMTTVDPKVFAPAGGPLAAALPLVDGRTLINGNIAGPVTAPALYIGRMDPDGAWDAGFVPRANATVYWSSPLADGRVLAGGVFNQVGAVPVRSVTLLSAGGVPDATFVPNPVGSTLAGGVQQDGRIVIAGAFSVLDGKPHTALARLAPDGTPEATFPSSILNACQSMALQPDGRILLCGDIRSVSGQNRTNIARLNPDGTLDTSFVAGIPSGTPLAMQLQADGRILVAGTFNLVNGEPHTNVVRLLPDGRVDHTFTAAVTGPIYTLGLQCDGKILLGGGFNLVNRVPQPYLCRLNPDGSLDPTFNPAPTGQIFSTALTRDGTVLLAGSFSSVKGLPRAALALVHNTDPATESVIPDSSGVTWLRGGTSPEAWRTTLEQSPDNGLTWISLGDGQRVPGGWRFSDDGVMPGRPLRLRGFATAGYRNGSSYFVETPGAPVIRLNGVVPSGGGAVFSGAVTISLQAPFPGGHILYTLDGSDPAEGPLYSGPFTLQGDATLRVIAYAEDFSLSSVSSPLTIAVARAPALDVSPQVRKVVEGSPVVLSAVATGTGPIDYIWSRDGQAVGGGEDGNLVLESIRLSDAGNYLVVASNRYGSTTGTVARVEVLSPPRITQAPAGTSVAPGADVTLCTTATGSATLLYQWRRNGQNLPDETNACLTLLKVGPEHGGAYTVVVANEAGAVTSPTALVQVTVPSAPVGDLFAGRVLLTGDTGAVSGSNALAGTEPGEPEHAGKPGGKSIWYRWIPSQTGVATIHTRGSSFDTLLAVYVGAILPGLQSVASDEDSGGFYTSLVKLPVQAGVEYEIAVDGFAGGTGRVVLSWSLEPSADVIPRIVQPPVPVAAVLGGDARFSATAAPAGVTYQWLFKGKPIPNATGSTLVVSPVNYPDVGSYAVQVQGSPGRVVVSEPVALEIGPDQAVVTYDKLQDLLNTAPPGVPQLAGSAPGAGYVQLRLGTQGSQVLNNLNSGTQAGEPNHCDVLASGRSRWFGVRITTNGVVVLDTRGSSIDTVMAVYGWAPDIRQVASNLIACDIDPAQFGSQVRFEVTDAPRDFLVAIDSVGAPIAVLDSNGTTESGLIHLNWRMGLAPVLLEVNGGGIAVAGEPRVLQAVGQGTGLGYEWTRNGDAIPGATQSTWVIPAIAPAQAGIYAVTLSNEFGSILGSVRLEVMAQPPRTWTVSSGRSAVLGAVVATGQEGCVPQYQWFYNGTLLEGVTGALLSLPRADLASAGRYSVQVTACGQSVVIPAGVLAVAGEVQVFAEALPGLPEFRFPPVSDPVCSVVLEIMSGGTLGAPVWSPVTTNTVPGASIELALPEDFRRRPGSVFRARLIACPP